MGHFQKIMLLVVVVPLALFPGALISYILMFKQLKFEALMWLPMGLTALGICSFIFHFKTKKVYRLLKKKEALPMISPFLWLLNIAFGIAHLVLSLYFLYIMYTVPTNKDSIVLLIVILPMFTAGAWTLFEAFYLHKLISVHKYVHRHSEIEDIKGNITEQ